MPALRNLICCAAVMMVAAGCAAFREPDEGPDYGGIVLELDTLAVIVNRRAASLGAVKGSGDLIIRTPDLGRRKLDISLVAQRPDRVRLQARFGLLASVFDFLADADSLVLYLPRERTVVVESPGESSGLPLVASREMVQALLQSSLNPRDVRDGGSFRSVPEGHEVVTLETDDDGGTTRRLFLFEPERLRLMRQEIEHRSVDGGGRRAVITYTRHRWTGAQWFPGTVTLELPDEGESLELSLMTFDPNPTIEPKHFTLRVPSGARRISAAELDDDFLREAPEAED